MAVWLQLTVSAAVFVGMGIAILFVLWFAVRLASKKISWLVEAYEDVRPRLRVFVFSLALLVSVSTTGYTTTTWWPITVQVLVIVSILAFGFLVQEVVNFAVLRFITRFEDGDQSDADTRRITTQLKLIRRLANAVIGLLTIGAALFTLPQVQALGAGVLASAGVLSVIGGLAAQAVLGNLFAGLQLAFSNAIRVGDVVVVEEEWGTIGEITLSYVVVYIWDERRLIVPSTYFTTKPFETWTRKSPKVFGVVGIDLDWDVPVASVRAEFHRFVEQSPLWDRRVANAQVVDASGGMVRVRFVASAQDSSTQWDLRCAIREHMVEWVRENYPHALPRTRVELSEQPRPARSTRAPSATRNRPSASK